MVEVDLVLFLLALTVCVAWGNAQSLTWSRMELENDVVPPARRYSAMAWHPGGSALYVFGGEGSDGALGESDSCGKTSESLALSLRKLLTIEHFLLNH